MLHLLEGLIWGHIDLRIVEREQNHHMAVIEPTISLLQGVCSTAALQPLVHSHTIWLIGRFLENS